MIKDCLLKLSALVAFLFAVLPSTQAATLEIDDFDIYRGSSQTASLNVETGAGTMINYKGFQFDLVLQPGLTVDFDATTPLTGFTFSGEVLSDGVSRFVVYLQDGANPAVNITDNLLSITFKADATAALGPNNIKIQNVIFSSPTGDDEYLDGSDFVITVLEEEEPPVPPTPDEPTVPASPIPDGTAGANNGTYVMPVKIREGNELLLGVNAPIGGYEDGFEYEWLDPDGGTIGDEREFYTPALLYGAAANAGVNQAISNNIYTVEIANFSPENVLFWETSLPTTSVEVYKRPQTPAQLLRKGQHPEGGQTPETGTSHTFVVMMTPLSNEQVSSLGYSYTFGYTDASGVMHTLETTSRRYTHTTDEIYWNSSYTFWAYSQWTYADGSVITSGLRYLDGTADEGFDASTFSGETRGETPGASGIGAVEAEGEITGIYSFDGRYVGTDPGALSHGMYIIRYANSVKKVIL